jgi:GntR family transcriptional regulator
MLLGMRSPDRGSTQEQSGDRLLLDPRSGVPLYMQVERSLRDRISAGEWAPGAQIPTEEKLCSAYGVSRVTVQQAMSNLVADGLVVRERGRGRFVRDSGLIARERGVTSFTTELHEIGLKPGSLVLERSVLTAQQADIADTLQLKKSDAVIRWKRLRTANDEPIALQTSVLPLRRFPGLEDADLEGASLYDILFERYGLLDVEAVDTYAVASLDQADAKLLSVPKGSPAFLVERLTLAADGPVEHTRSLIRGDRYRVRLTLGARPAVHAFHLEDQEAGSRG